jgi:hypothetical protein
MWLWRSGPKLSVADSDHVETFERAPPTIFPKELMFSSPHARTDRRTFDSDLLEKFTSQGNFGVLAKLNPAPGRQPKFGPKVINDDLQQKDTIKIVQDDSPNGRTISYLSHLRMIGVEQRFLSKGRRL